MLTHESMIPRLGDTFAIDICNVPAFIRRDSDGVIKGYINSCPHRGGPLFWNGVENKKTILCKYHAWSFKNSGELKGISTFGCDVSCLDKNKTSLKEIAVKIADGFVFVNLCLNRDCASAPAPDYDFLSQKLFDKSKDVYYYGDMSFSVRANWKLYVETWLEDYHFGYLHPSLAKEISVKQCKVTSTPSCVLCESVSASPEGVFDGVWGLIYPCTGLEYYKDGFGVELIFPVNKNETLVKYLFFFQIGIMQEQIDRTIKISEDLIHEDIAACEHIQKTLGSGVFTTGFLSPVHEDGLSGFHEKYR